MATLKGTDHATLTRYLEGHYSRTIGNNTTARREDDSIIVALHGHDIARLFADGRVGFTLAGWPTVTTRERLNQFLPQRWCVHQDRLEQYVADRANDWKRTRIDDYSAWFVVSQDSPDLIDAQTYYAVEVGR